MTGIVPSTLNDPVAGGSVRFAVRPPVARSTVAASVPGPRVSVELTDLMTVWPFTG